MEMAARLRRETTLSLKQIAQRLHLGTRRSASERLYKAMKAPARWPAVGEHELPLWL
jgi:hypothetical protein